MTFVLRVNTVADPPGTDITEYVPLNGKSIKLTRQINGRGQLSFDAEGDVSDLGSLLAPGVAVSFTEGGDLLFGGIIDSVEETGVYPGYAETRVRYSVECVSFATILDRRIVRRAWIGQTAADIMDDIVAEYIGAAADDPEGFNTITWTGGIDGSTVIPRLEAFYKPVSWILDQICKLVGADWSVPPAATSIIFTGDGGGAAITQRNMIAANSGFESNSFSYWTYWNTATDHEISSASKWEGTYSYYITNTSEDAGIYRNVTTVEGYRYVVSVYCYNVTSSGSTMRLEVTDALGSPVATAYPQTTGAWERLIVSYAPQGAYLTVRLGGVGQAYFDAAMVELDGNMSGRAGTYLPGDALPKDAHRISLRKDRDSYSNVITVSTLKSPNDQAAGDNTRTYFPTSCFIISPPEVTVSRGSETLVRRVLSAAEATETPVLVVKENITGLGWGQPASGGREVRVRSDDAGDVGTKIRIIGTYVLDAIGQVYPTYTPTAELNGTNWVYFNSEDWQDVCAIQLEEEVSGTVTVEVGSDGYGWDTCVTIPDGVSAGIVSLPSAGADLYMRPLFRTTVDLLSRKLRILHRSDNASTWAVLPDHDDPEQLSSQSYPWYPAELTGNSSTEYYGGVVSDHINQVFIGNVSTGDQISVYVPAYEWTYEVDKRGVTQNTTSVNVSDSPPTGSVSRPLMATGIGVSPETISISYHGIRTLDYTSESAAEVSARATAEGGSGRYEHVETVDDTFTSGQQAGLANDLIKYYSRNTGGSLFPRQTLTFATWSYRFRTPGNRFTATLARHGLDADTFTITQVDMSRTSAPAGTSLAWEYTVTASIGRAAGDWAKRFKDLLPARRILWARTNG